MLAGFEHEVLGLFGIAFGDILSDALHRHFEQLLLICLFLTHNLGNDFGCQALLIAYLLEAASLRERRSTIINLYKRKETP